MGLDYESLSSAISHKNYQEIIKDNEIKLIISSKTFSEYIVSISEINFMTSITIYYSLS